MRGFKNDLPKKVEMVPLIDVIFLLLIFFLVTLNIIPIITQADVTESQFAMPIVTDSDPARVDMLIQVYYHQSANNSQVHYFTVDAESDEARFCESAWNDIVNLSNEHNLEALKKKFPNHNYASASKIFGNKELNEVIISADPWVPYEDLFAVIDECRKGNRNIQYYCTVGSFENLRGKIQFTNRDVPKEKWKW